MTNSNLSWSPGLPKMAMFCSAPQGLLVGIVLELLVEPLDPVGVEDALVNIANQRLLVLGVEIAIDRQSFFIADDVPVIGNVSPQQTAFGVLVVPVEANFFLLGISQGAIERLDGGFRGALGSGRRLDPWRGEQRQAAAGHRGGGCRHGLEEAAPVEIELAPFAIRTDDFLGLIHGKLPLLGNGEGPVLALGAGYALFARW